MQSSLETYARIRAEIRRLEKLAAELEEDVKRALEDLGGAAETGSGKLHLRKQVRREIDAGRLSDSELRKLAKLGAVRVSVSKLGPSQIPAHAVIEKEITAIVLQ